MNRALVTILAASIPLFLSACASGPPTVREPFQEELITSIEYRVLSAQRWTGW